MDSKNIQEMIRQDIKSMRYPYHIGVEVDNRVKFIVSVTDGESHHKEIFSAPLPEDIVTLPGVAKARHEAACYASSMVHMGLTVY